MRRPGDPEGDRVVVGVLEAAQGGDGLARLVNRREPLQRRAGRPGSPREHDDPAAAPDQIGGRLQRRGEVCQRCLRPCAPTPAITELRTVRGPHPPVRLDGGDPALRTAAARPATTSSSPRRGRGDPHGELGPQQPAHLRGFLEPRLLAGPIGLRRPRSRSRPAATASSDDRSGPGTAGSTGPGTRCRDRIRSSPTGTTTSASVSERFRIDPPPVLGVGQVGDPCPVVGIVDLDNGAADPPARTGGAVGDTIVRVSDPTPDRPRTSTIAREDRARPRDLRIEREGDPVPGHDHLAERREIVRVFQRLLDGGRHPGRVDPLGPTPGRRPRAPPGLRTPGPPPGNPRQRACQSPDGPVSRTNEPRDLRRSLNIRS